MLRRRISVCPTVTERESNARRLAALGTSAIVMPVEAANGEKQIDVDEFGATVRLVLGERESGAARGGVDERIWWGAGGGGSD
jgi:hypothetical protein